MLNVRGKVLGGLVLGVALAGCPNPTVTVEPSTKPSSTSVKKSPKPGGSPSPQATKTPAGGAVTPTVAPTKTPAATTTPTPTPTPSPTPQGTPTPIATATPVGTPTPAGTATPAAGTKAATTFVGSATRADIGLQDGKGAAVRFYEPNGIVVAADETVYVTDTNSHALRKCSPDGTVLTVSGNQKAGKNNGQGVAASFNLPKGVAMATDGTIFVADTGNHMIRKYATTGLVTLVAGTGSAGKANGFGDAASFDAPDGLAVGSDGAVYVADTNNHLIRRIVLDATGTATVTTLAGSGTAGSADGVGETASFRAPQGIVAAPGGVLYVATVSDNLIRKIVVGADGKGTVTTIAGQGAGLKDGPGLEASFNQPSDLAIDKSGNLYVADLGNAAVRKIVIGADGKATVSTVLGGDATKIYANSIGVSPSGKVYVTELGISRVVLIQ